MTYTQSSDVLISTKFHANFVRLSKISFLKLNYENLKVGKSTMTFTHTQDPIERQKTRPNHISKSVQNDEIMTLQYKSIIQTTERKKMLRRFQMRRWRRWILNPQTSQWSFLYVSAQWLDFIKTCRLVNWNSCMIITHLYRVRNQRKKNNNNRFVTVSILCVVFVQCLSMRII